MSETNVTTNSTESSTSTEPVPTSLITAAPTEGEVTPPASTTPPEKESVAPVVEFVPLVAEDITLPKGFTADQELTTEFLSVVNNQELSAKDRANALVELQTKAIAKASEAGSAAWETMQNEWREAVKADPVVGGDKQTAALASVNKLVTEYGDTELTKVLALTGAGNNVHVIKFLHTLAGKLTEGSFTQGQPTNAPVSAAALLYPSMKG